MRSQKHRHGWAARYELMCRTPVLLLIVQGQAADVLVTREAFEIYKLTNRCHIVSDAGSAVAALNGARPDLIMLDPDLPGVDGRALLQRLRADPTTADVPVVMLARTHAEEQRLRAEELPVQGYARKPVDFDAVAAAVRAIGDLGFTVSRRR